MDFKETMRKAIEGDEEALSVINEPNELSTEMQEKIVKFIKKYANDLSLKDLFALDQNTAIFSRISKSALKKLKKDKKAGKKVKLLTGLDLIIDDSMGQEFLEMFDEKKLLKALK